MGQKIVQLDLFSDQKELENAEFKKMTQRSFRALFARYNDLEMAFLELDKKIERLNDHVFDISPPEKSP